MSEKRRKQGEAEDVPQSTQDEQRPSIGQPGTGNRGKKPKKGQDGSDGKGGAS